MIIQRFPLLQIKIVCINADIPSARFVLIVQTLINFLIPSGSGQAAIVIGL